mgnify:CR=1 FL=1
MKRHLDALVRNALTEAIAAGELAVSGVPAFTLESPSDAAFGDLACNVAMVLAREARRPPRAVADVILRRLRDPDGWLASVEVAGPGFINFRFTSRFWRTLLGEALAAGERYGRSTLGAGQAVQVEFVSANPTGPLHVGHGRGAVVGDVVARLLDTVGFAVEREYYVNDFGRQMDLLGQSTLARWRELQGEPLALPQDGYPGAYLVDIARRLRERPEGATLGEASETEAVARCRDFAAEALLADIRSDLERFGVRFDNFVSERRLHEAGFLEKALAALPADLLYVDDGALFFRSTAFGDDKDRAVRRQGGVPTYFGGDMAHFYATLARGFSQLVMVLGADHHGYVPRLRAIVEALGHPPERLRVVLVQLVNLTRRGEPVRMGKRAGEFVTLREVVDEVGVDAARFFFLLRKADSQLDFDLELAKRQSAENPVFYVQYAYTRIAGVLRHAAECGVEPEARPDLGPLGDAEAESLRTLAIFPDVVEQAARTLEPHKIAFYAMDVAGTFHRYYNRHRVISPDGALTQARLALMRCYQQVLRLALGLAGVAAPERM